MILVINYLFCFFLQYAEKIASWSQACDNMNIPNEATVLETCIHQHQTIYESMCQAYTEVCVSYEKYCKKEMSATSPATGF